MTFLLIAFFLLAINNSLAQVDEIQTKEKLYTVVRIYLKETDSTIVMQPIKFETDLNNPGWIEFITDYRNHFLTGGAQHSSRYQIQADIDGVKSNTQLNLRFSEIALIHINTVKYGYDPDCINQAKDQYCKLILKDGKQIEPFLGSYNNGLSNLSLYFETKYLSGNVTGKKIYVIKGRCGYITNEFLLDWNFVRGLQLSHKIL
jgi:hypothetical protein